MKLKQVILFGAIVAAITTSCGKTVGTVNLKNDTDSVSYYLGIYTGQNIKQLDFTKLNYEVYEKALKEVMNSKEEKADLSKGGIFLNNYFTKLQDKKSEVYLKEGRDFLDKNKTKKGVKTTASGLQYEVIKEGTGPKPKLTDMVTVQYKGTLIDGTVFESTDETNHNHPAIFELGTVIPGWIEALQLMSAGSKYKVYLPTELAYGKKVRSGGKIKPNMALIFEIELLSFAPKPVLKDDNFKGKGPKPGVTISKRR